MKKKITILLVTTLLTASIPVFAVNTNDIKDQVNDNNEKIDILEQEKSDLQKNKKIVFPFVYSYRAIIVFIANRREYLPNFEAET